MIQRSEFYLKTPDTYDSIFVQRWQPAAPKLTLFLTHGVAEHSDCYHMTAESLASQGIEVYAWDLPGHGKSYGQRGYISSFSEYTDRLSFVLEEVKKITQNKTPIVLFGHSLGGLITTQFALNYNGKHGCKAICLSSPGFGVAVKVPFIKDQMARLLVNLAPKLTIPHQLNFEDLSRDASITSTYSKDPLRHSKYSAPLYIGMLAAMEDSIERAHQLRDRFFIQAAGVDRIVDLEATKAFYSRLGSQEKQLKIYPDSYHEIFNDLNRKEVIDDLVSYLRQFTNESKDA
jgi:alpha-beta hydrolase superfamily lysophospholipase